MPKRYQLTKANVTRVLKAAGHPAAKFHRSHQVRGWGRWSYGFQVLGTGSIVVEWEPGGSDPDNAKQREKLAELAGPLSAHWAVAPYLDAPTPLLQLEPLAVPPEPRGGGEP